MRKTSAYARNRHSHGIETFNVAATTREVCGTLPDGSEFCTIVTTTRSPQ